MIQLSAEFNKPVILIVDDQPDNLRVLSSMLMVKGYNVRKAITGKMALATCQKVVPDLILLDIMMPDLSGYEVCESLQSNPLTCQVPVIFLSALDDSTAKVKAFSSGGADYITKPFQTEEVLARIHKQLTIERLQRQLVQKNQELQTLNKELRRSNTELEQFAGVASHDLQSPLQLIMGYADMLRWQYDTLLDEKGEHYLSEISKASQRMNQLIQDLLSYSRVRAGNVELEPIDCEVVLTEALANLQDDINGSGACITHDPLPIVIGDRTQLIQLFQNILSNAIKFRRPQVTPKINISLTFTEQKFAEFRIQDNGIGIAEENYPLVFEIFKRIHPYNQYPGTGIGMSLCKKIIERHGGCIGVDSQLNTGTTFFFTLTLPSQVQP
ncbi:response regulator [Oscillatoria acuminata]|uniref:histidine kinase n=1 Tax=Oscillatoria acuminata PCC 6304 TaxID=56110 RepID=K9TKX0_9CYAN|nr:response regulator [Oscillatoria acuminata]AFY83053.1 bacteriophytochrome (light-regulated signal transduction histidine kinase) [Oscillatoria acuminata PCC 6304]